MNLKDIVVRIAMERGIYSVAALERRAGLGNGTIKKWNDSMPSIDKLMAVANALGVSVGFILGENSQIENVENKDRLLNELFMNQDYRDLIGVASKCTSEEIKSLVEMIKVWKK